MGRDARHRSTVNVHFLNCFTCHARVPSSWHTGALCLLVESDRGLVLVDTGLGREDYVHPPLILRAFRVVTRVPMRPEEAAVRQVVRLGYGPEDVRQIVLTHMHFDHAGGLPDFPHARIHVHRREHAAFMGSPRHWLDVGYVRRHVAHRPDFVLHDDSGERWLDFSAIRLPFEPEMWLVPLFGHTRGHCGVAVWTDSGWLFHVGAAAPFALTRDIPEGVARFVTGPHISRLRAFRAAHPEVRMTTGHMWLDFFDSG